MRRVVGLRTAALWTACLLGGLLAGQARAENKRTGRSRQGHPVEDDRRLAGRPERSDSAVRERQDRGLDQANGQFAKNLLAAALLERGSTLSGAIMGARGADPSWRQIRKLALADLERVVEIDPKQAQAWVLIARLNIVLPNGDARRAAEAVDRALAASEDSPSIRSEALVMRAAIAKGASAKLADLNEAVKLAPKNAAAFRARGLARADDNQLALALADLDRALELEPQHLPTLAAKAMLLASMKKFEQATATIDKARTWAPGCAVPLTRGRIHAMQGDLKAAVTDLNEANALDPGNLDVLLLRAASAPFRARRTARWPTWTGRWSAAPTTPRPSACESSSSSPRRNTTRPWRPWKPSACRTPRTSPSSRNWARSMERRRTTPRPSTSIPPS